MAIPQHHHPHGLRHSAGARRPHIVTDAGSGWIVRIAQRLRRLVRRRGPSGLVVLPAELRVGPLAESYLAAERSSDHPRAGAAAVTASRQALESHEWRAADIWAHRALWHFERAGMALHATRAARRIGDVRVAAGDWKGSRRYFAEAISEARDLGAEREEGLAAMGLGRAEIQLGNVTTGRRLADGAAELLERCGAPHAEVLAARQLRGEVRAVGPASES